jgi:hypothetical protein
MSKKRPVPPEQRSPKDPGAVYQDVMEKEPREVLRNFEKESAGRKGEQANIRHNTRNQGYQQDR